MLLHQQRKVQKKDIAGNLQAAMQRVITYALPAQVHQGCVVTALFHVQLNVPGCELNKWHYLYYSFYNNCIFFCITRCKFN